MNPTEMELQAITYNRACAHTKLGDLPAACEDLKRAYVPGRLTVVSHPTISPVWDLEQPHGHAKVVERARGTA